MSSIRRFATHWLLLCCLFLYPSVANAADPASATGHRAIVNRVPPVYPELARRMHVSGTVILRVIIRPDGTVSETHIESGHPLLVGAAQEAVARWRFSPAPEPTTMNIDIVFDQSY